MAAPFADVTNITAGQENADIPVARALSPMLAKTQSVSAPEPTSNLHAQAETLKKSAHDIITWQSPHTKVIFAIMNVCMWVWYCSESPLLFLVCWAALLRVFCGFAMTKLAKMPVRKGSDWTAADLAPHMDFIVSALNHVKSLKHKILDCCDVRMATKIALGLYCATFLCKLLSPFALLYLGLLGVFGLPKACELAYEHFQTQITQALQMVQAEWKTRTQFVTHKQITQGGIIAALLFFCVVSWSTVLIFGGLGAMMGFSYYEGHQEELDAEISKIKKNKAARRITAGAENLGHTIKSFMSPAKPAKMQQ